MRIRLAGTSLALAGLACLAAAVPADEPSSSLQPSEGAPEDPILPLSPQKPLSEEETSKIEAEKLFVVGLGQLNRRELLPAMRSFEEALRFDPKNLPILKELVPLALQLGEPARGLEYCQRALELDPENYRLLMLYASRQADLGRLDGAVETLQKAAAIEGVLAEDSRAYLQIRFDLVQFLEALKRFEESIPPLEDLVRAAEDPEKYGLTEFGRRQLERRKFADLEQLGRALAKAGRVDEALRVLERGRESDDPRAKRLALVLAEVRFEQGDLEKAAEELNAYLAAGARNREALELYTKILDKQGRPGDLRPQLAKWLESDEDNQELREFYVRKLIDAGEYELAERQLERMRRSRASTVALMAKLYRKMNQPAKLLAALVESDRGRGESADADLQDLLAAVAEEPETVDALARAARDLPADRPDRFAAQIVVARIADQAKLPDLAVEFLSACVEERPTLLPLQGALLELLWRNKRYQELLDAVERAERANPAQKAAFVEQHARALEQLGRVEEGIELLLNFVKEAGAGPDALLARLELARMYMQAEQFDRSIETCRSVLADYPDSQQSGYTRYLLGTVLFQSGRAEESEKILLELLEDPTINDRLAATVNNDLGYTWADQGKNLDRAEVLIRKALDAQPGQAAYLDSLGWVLFKKGDYAQAVKYLRQAAEDEDGQDAVIYDHLGDALWKLDEADEAKAAWEKALKLLENPKTKKEREQRAQIEKKLRLLAGAEAADAD